MERSVSEILERGERNGWNEMMDWGIGIIMGEKDVRKIKGVVEKDKKVSVRGEIDYKMYEKWVEIGLKKGFGDDILRIKEIKEWVDG